MVLVAETTPPPPVGDGFDRDRAIEAFESVVAEVCGHLHGLHAKLVSLTADALTHGWWQQSGIKSPEHWLGWQTGLSAGHAANVVAAARRRDQLPVTMAAFDAGELSLDQVSPIVAKAPSWADAQVCALARQCTVGQIRVAVGRYTFPEVSVSGHGAASQSLSGSPAGSPAGSAVQPAQAGELTNDRGDQPHPDEPGPQARPTDHEFWSFTGLEDGNWRASGRFDPDHGLVIDAALREVADALFRDGGRVPSGVEVLAEMARRSLCTVTDSARRDRYRVHVLLDERNQMVDPLGYCLPGWLRDLITCDAKMAVTWIRNGVPIAQGSTAEVVAPAIRRHVLARDGRCRVPGCGSSKRLDLHHIVHRSNGGTNDASNLIALCPHHHRVHHRGQLGIAGTADDPEGLRFSDGRGSPLGVNLLVQPPTGPPPTPTGRYRHPLGERLDPRWVFFFPPPEQRESRSDQA
jgi:hypothetical protein